MNDFFAVEPVPVDTTGWTTLADLAADPSARITETARALSTDDARAAASIDLLAVAARVLSPALARALLTSSVEQLSADTVWWRHDRPALLRIAWHPTGVVPATGAAFEAAVVRPVLAPLVDGYCAAVRLSSRVAWGDVASALNGAASAVGSTEAYALARATLDVGVLAGAALRPPPRFVRNSCCLYYRLPGGGLCGDCVLRRRRSVQG